MRIAVALVVTGATAAHAAPKSPAAEVEAQVRAVLKEPFDKVLADNTRADAVLVNPGNTEYAFAGFGIAAPAKIAVQLDASGKVAWFQATTTGIFDAGTGDECYWNGHCDGPKPFPLHVSGVSIDDGGWKIAALVVSEPVPDRDLIAGAKVAVKVRPVEIPKPGVEGDGDLARDATAWFASPSLGKNAATGTVIATGSAPDELATGAAAVKLAAKWDKLKLIAGKIKAKTLAGNSIGVVRAEVVWPYTKTVLVPLALTAICVREKLIWKWIVLDFSPQ